MDELINKRSVVYTSSTTDHREIYDATILILVIRNKFITIPEKRMMIEADGFMFDPFEDLASCSEETGAEKEFFFRC